MGLLQNGYRHNLTGKLLGATNQDGANAYVQVYRGHRTATNRNMLAGEGIAGKLAGVPDGNLPPSAWIMPFSAGRMSARTASLVIDATGNGVMGLPGGGSASFSIVFADATGGLIASGGGSAQIVFSTNNPLITASISGSGSAPMTIGATGAVGALAFMTGETSCLMATSGVIHPLSDTSPLRTGTASFLFSGTLTPYAIGHMEGTTDVETELTASAIVNAVWGAVGTEYNQTGTMGNKLNTASSGGVDLNALADAVWGAAEADNVADAIEFLQKTLKNKREIKKVGATWTLVIYDDDGTTPIISKALKDFNGAEIADLAAGVLAAEGASSV